MKTVFSAVQAFIADEDGVTAIEYALIAALVGVAIVSAATDLGGQITKTFRTVIEKMGGPAAPV